MESEYRQEQLGGGRTRFIITPASVPKASLIPLLLGGMAGLIVFVLVLGDGGLLRTVLASLGAIFIGLLVSTTINRHLAHRVARHRSPGGTFIASPTGLELPTGSVIPQGQLHRLILRNGIPDADFALAYDPTALAWQGMWLLPEPDPATAAQRGNAASVSYLLCAEHGGGSTTLAGGMTETTAFRLLRDAGRILQLSR